MRQLALAFALIGCLASCNSSNTSISLRCKLSDDEVQRWKASPHYRSLMETWRALNFGDPEDVAAAERWFRQNYDIELLSLEIDEDINEEQWVNDEYLRSSRQIKWYEGSIHYTTYWGSANNRSNIGKFVEIDRFTLTYEINVVIDESIGYYSGSCTKLEERKL